MINLIIFLFILGILIIVHEFGHFVIAKRSGVTVERFSLGFGPVLLRKKKSGTEYTVSALPLGGYVKLAGDDPLEYKGSSDEYLSKLPGERAKIIFFGPLLNYVLGALFFWLIFVAGYPMLTTKVGGLIEGLGAIEAGIRTGDKIIAVDAKKVEFWEELQKTIQAKKENSVVRISLLRDNKEYLIEVKVKTKEFEDLLGKKRSVGLLGITPDEEIIKVRHGFFKSFILSINKTWELTALTYNGLWRMVTGKISVRESVTGPLGIFYITSKASSAGLITVLHLVAVLSVSLAIFNLLPLPVLDGGHLLLLLVEKIRGRRLGLKVDQIITQIGITMIISLAVFVTYNDIMRFFGDKIFKTLNR